MFHLIGLGLNENSVTAEALTAIKKYKKVYLEKYTVSLPYKIQALEKKIKKKIILLNREQVESLQFLKEAKKQSITLLVYGSPLFATTHITILEECKKNKIPYQILFNASVFDAVAETGLQLYKFGKIASMPKWSDNYKPDSFVNYLVENKKTDSHSLLLIDPFFDCVDALQQFETACSNKLPVEKIVICSKLGTKSSKIVCGTINQLQNKKVSEKIQEPFCFIIPAQLHFVEEEWLDNFSL
ncbi:MAG: diphthine synthase [archaeon]|jgi:diphthine synthase